VWAVTKIVGRGSWRFDRFFRDQHRLLIVLNGAPPELWDTQRGKRVAILDNTNPIEDCDISPCGTLLITAEAIGGWHFALAGERRVVRCLRIWNLGTGKLIKEIRIDLSTGNAQFCSDWEVRWLAKPTVLLQLNSRASLLHPSGGIVLALVDISAGGILKWSKPLDVGDALLLSPDRTRAVATGSNGMWRNELGHVIIGGIGRTYRAHLLDLQRMAVIGTLDVARDGQEARPILVGNFWSADGRSIATVGSDKIVRVWDGLSGKPVSEAKGHTDAILSVRFSPDGCTLLTASEDGTARLWDVRTGKLRRTLRGHATGLSEAAFDTTGQLVLTAGEDRTARLWDAASGKQIYSWPGHESAVREVAFAASDREVRTRTVGGAVRNWSVSNGLKIGATSIESTPNGRFGALFVKGSAKEVEVWAGPVGAPGEDISSRVLP
jgi:WD40 repeat protein